MTVGPKGRNDGLDAYTKEQGQETLKKRDKERIIASLGYYEHYQEENTLKKKDEINSVTNYKFI